MICEYKVRKFCCEDISLIENYDKAIADTTQTWHCHHRLELIETGAVVNSSMQDLKDWGIYYNRPADELIFLTKSEHRRLHSKHKVFTEETKRKISDIKKGRQFTEEHKKRLSDAAKNRSDEWRRKQSESHKGKGHKHSEETIRKMKEARKRYWQERKNKGAEAPLIN